MKDISNITFTDSGIFPTLEEVIINNNVFIKVPRLYRKINSTDSPTDNITVTVIAITE